MPLEIKITVQNPCLDKTYRKFLEIVEASDIIFPIGSNSTDVEINWIDQVDFVEMANMTKACGPSIFKVNPPSNFQFEFLEKD